MSAAPRAWLLAAAGVGLLLAATLAAELRGTQQALQRQLAARNHEAAAVLAAALSLPGQDDRARRAVAAAQFAAGHTLSLRLLAAGPDAVLAELQRAPAAAAVPDWFVRLLPLHAPPGTAGWGEAGAARGTLELQTDPSWAQQALWLGARRSGLVALLLALASLGLLSWSRLRRDDAPASPSAGAAGAAGMPAAEAGDGGARDWQQAYAEQAQQLVRLQRQALLDAGTGLPVRHDFLARLQQRLDDADGPALGLLIVRLLDLEATNLRLGHAATDRLLVAVADVLLTYVDRVPALHAGRLNGSDFALCLPVAGVAAETAASLRAALAAAPALRGAHAELAVGGVDGLRAQLAGDALARADAALAQAEAQGDPSACVVLQAAAGEAVMGAGAWRERVRQALLTGQARLQCEPVRDAQGRLLHQACALQLQLHEGGGFDAPDRWRAAARRGRLLPLADLKALEGVIAALHGDGRARAVHLSQSSLGTPGFQAEVLAAVAALPASLRDRLTLEIVNDVRTGEATPALVAGLSAWSGAGLRLGLDCGRAAPPDLPALQAAGLQHLSVQASAFQGLAHDDAVRSYARGLVALVHGLGLRLVVSGVDDADDAAALWALGVDAASGAAVRAASDGPKV